MSYKTLYADKSIRKTIPFAVVFAAVVLVYFFPQDDIRTLLIFVALLLVFLIYKFDMRIFIFFAISVLITGAILTVLGSDEPTSRVALISFWLLVTGITGIAIDLFKRVLQDNKKINR